MMKPSQNLMKGKATTQKGKGKGTKKEEDDRSMCNQETTPKSTNKGSKTAT
jgi:hypothetical protein